MESSTAIAMPQPSVVEEDESMEVFLTLSQPKVVVREPTLEELPALLASMGLAAPSALIVSRERFA